MSVVAVDLRAEFAPSPAIVATPRPRFAWRSQGDAGAPSSYHLIVASRPALLAAGVGDLWDTGERELPRSSLVEFGGRALASRDRAWWSVRLLDEDGWGSWSAAAVIEVPLLEARDWSAEWISWPVSSGAGALYFRHQFDIGGAIASARLYGVGLGWGEFWINGRRIGDAVLDPAQTDTSRRVLYATYDVTEYLQSGANVLGAVVASGWSGSRALIAQLEITGADGIRHTVATGRRGADEPFWYVAAGPVVEAGIFDGEVYDSRLESTDWARPVAEPWGPMRMLGHAHSAEGPSGTLQPQTAEPIAVVETREAVSVSEPLPRVFVADTGQNLAGWCRITVRGKRGDVVRLRYAESLRADGTVNQANLRSALARDEYTLRGEAEEVWEPRFTYHGFRYVQVEGAATAPRLEIRVVRSALAETGEFDCSDQLVRRIGDAVRWTEASNLHGVPTDCPQRDERMGWLNDMTARTEELVHSFDASRFLAKWMDDIADTQDVRGAIADTAPFRLGNRPADPVSVAYVLIPWLLYRHYGDDRTMRRHWSGMTQWAAYLDSRAEHGIVDYGYYGDWAPPLGAAVGGSLGSSALSAETPLALVSTAHYAATLDLLARMAPLVGDDPLPFMQRARGVCAAFHRRWWNVDRQGYGSGSQAANAIALHLGLVPQEHVGDVVASMVADVEARGHLATGNLATKYLLEVLAEHGRGDLAYGLVARRDYPSWGFMLDNGATTIWERWEHETGRGMNSHNHPMYASVGAWLYRRLAGIRLADDAVGFSSVLIDPVLPAGLHHASAALETVRGHLSSAWRRDGDDVVIELELPDGCDAAVRVGAEEWVSVSTPGPHSFRRYID